MATDGEWWSDRARRSKNDPAKRYRIARNNRPYPAAFREMAIALRAEIRAKRKKREDYSAELADLYRTAATHDFLFATPYLGEEIGPAYNAVIKADPLSWQTLDFPYDKLGHEHISLLNKTDRKWLVAEWGEPSGHRNPQELHAAVWGFIVDAARPKRRARKPVPAPANQSGCLVLLAVLGSAVASLLLYV